MVIKIFHFFPCKLNLYGDQGNIITLVKRAEWRDIDVEVVEVNDVHSVDFTQADLLFIGGGSDREQLLCTEQLRLVKNELSSMIEDEIPMLSICGGYQFLGDYYITVQGEILKGLNILDFYTEAQHPRLVGPIQVESEYFGRIVGFENHSGRTYHNYRKLGNVLRGYGNNDTDKTEGIFYKNVIGTYLHGPILPNNPVIADFLLQKAIERRYPSIKLEPLNDKFSNLISNC
ncbi:type 1 glutamine amidotransferase [Bacillus cereus]|uniref:type 1 glutamine amidotransferase n=1 Tax=Bacillus cereus TaxID=1396 RepID=UPI000C29331C|nr:glutamine amidotransferase [Bacillus cereus]